MTESSASSTASPAPEASWYYRADASRQPIVGIAPVGESDEASRCGGIDRRVLRELETDAPTTLSWGGGADGCISEVSHNDGTTRTDYEFVVSGDGHEVYLVKPGD